MTSEPNTDIPPLADYLAGETSAANAVEIKRRILKDPEYRTLVTTLQQSQDALRASGHQHVNIERMSLALQASLESPNANAGRTSTAARPEGTDVAQPGLRRNNPRVRNYLIAGAGAVFSLVAGIAGYSVINRGSAPQLEATQTVYATSRGEQATIKLADGTRVTLNVGSTLTIPADFGRNNRTLTLQGEALFTVVQHPSTPFIITASNTSTRVLGTTFGVSAYAGDPAVRVAVREGRVMTNQIVLSQNDIVDVASTGTATVMRGADVTSVLSFADGYLVLTDIPLEDAIPQLNRWFNVDIHVADAVLRTKLLTGTYPKGSISDLSEFLAGTFTARVVRDGQKLTVYAR